MCKTLFTVVIQLIFLYTATAQSARDKQVIEAVDKIESKCIAWRRDIHQNPELSNREKRTAALIAEQLRSFGIEVKEGVAKTGVIGILKGGKPGPVIGLRADIDALPVTERVDISYASKAKATFNG
ncbi:MAG TPA: hypothetical protein VM888_06735, partial [Chitinophagaceae bacterium]|nr:hypothetical protein [Chitinophagaceae bacterium]